MFDPHVTAQGAVPLLDRGTLNDEIPGQGVESGAFRLTVWPTCGEAVAQYAPLRDEPPPEGSEVDWDNLGRSVRRSRGALRRYNVHNGLGYMPTLTFRNAPDSMRGVNAAMSLFRRRVRYVVGDEPWLWVPERGKKGRLHVHYAVGWWERLAAVEVCERCASPSLSKVRSDVPDAGSFCIGCLWGHGWVGRPSEAVGDPRALAGYVSKYVGKDLVGLVAPGANRYRVARGHQPEAMRGRVESWRAAVGILRRVSSGGVVQALHDEIESWEGPPTWTVTW